MHLFFKLKEARELAQLKDTIVLGSLSATDSLLATTVQASIFKAPSTSGGSSYGAGSNGQFLRSNSSTAYWGSLAESDIPNLTAYVKKSGGTDGVMTGTLTLKGLKGTTNVDYGTTLPSSPAEGQIFFQISDPWYELPIVGSGDNGKILKVVNGAWAAASDNIGSLSSLNTTAQTNVVAAINEINTNFSNTFTKSYVTLTSTVSGVQFANNNSCKINGIVYLSCFVQINAGVTIQPWTPICTLPSNCLPKVEVNFLIGPASAYLTPSSGQISLRQALAAGSGTAQHAMTIAYPLNNGEL